MSCLNVSVDTYRNIEYADALLDASLTEIAPGMLDTAITPSEIHSFICSPSWLKSHALYSTWKIMASCQASILSQRPRNRGKDRRWLLPYVPCEQGPGA